jgi:hypothetical protein
MAYKDSMKASPNPGWAGAGPKQNAVQQDPHLVPDGVISQIRE